MLINKILDIKGAKYDYREILMKFERSLPQNEVEQVDNVVKLKGIISDATLLAMVPGIENPVDEQARIDKEQEEVDKRLAATGIVDLDKTDTEPTK